LYIKSIAEMTDYGKRFPETEVSLPNVNVGFADMGTNGTAAYQKIIVLITLRVNSQNRSA